MEDHLRRRNWKRWGPYLSERQWATVREDYSADGDVWNYFSHDQAPSRAYRWGEDGLLGFADRECRLCFALALWNGRDPILKERLFGLTNPQGNHGEDVKEYYFYLDCTPTCSYVKSLYKYPQLEFPYRQLVEVNAARGRDQSEYELLDTGVFEGNRYFDVQAEYAKAAPNDILIRLGIWNRAGEPARLDVLPTLWFRNTWSFGAEMENWDRPVLHQVGAGQIAAEHESLGDFLLTCGQGPAGLPPLLFTENNTNCRRLFGCSNPSLFVKDAFHDYLIHGRQEAVNPRQVGTKAAAWYRLEMPAGGMASLRLRLSLPRDTPPDALGPQFDAVFQQRQAEADEFYNELISPQLSPAARQTCRQAYAGLISSRQFYFYVVRNWLEGDPGQPPPPPPRKTGRNYDWTHLFNRNVLSMPDKWEYPWYASWDMGFQMVASAKVDGQFAKEQLMLLLREWFMSPAGQVPAYEFSLSNVNPPVLAWACWRVYKIATVDGRRDRNFLESTFQKLLLNFTWWVNRKDLYGRHIFSGGFLGMDNIAVLDRSQPGLAGRLEQADATAWVAFYCVTMLAMALELARQEGAYEDMASKFFTHFIGICDAINNLGGTGLWDEQDGMYYDRLEVDAQPVQLRIRSLVGLIPLLAVEVLDDHVIGRFKGFTQRMEWFLEHRADLAEQVSYMTHGHGQETHSLRLLAIPSRQRLLRILRYMLDENEFLSPYGLRSLSRYHQDHPFILKLDGQEHKVGYEPGMGLTSVFGGNSNWRGPVWFPVNYLLIEALERYHHFYGDSLTVECPTGSGQAMNLLQVANLLKRRLSGLFLPDQSGWAPWQGPGRIFADDPHWRGLPLFHEFFHGQTGQGLGSSHQTGWTALVVRILEDLARNNVNGEHSRSSE